MKRRNNFVDFPHERGMHHLLLIKLLRKHFSTEDNIIVGVPAEERGGVVIVGVAVRLRAVCLKDLQRFLKFLLHLKLFVYE